MRHGRIRAILATEVALALRAIEDGEFFLSYGLKVRRPGLIEEGVLTILSGVRQMAALLGRRATRQNPPPLIPSTPGEWLLTVRAGIGALKRAARNVRRARGRISSGTLKRMETEIWRLEERVVLRARRMRDEFKSRWPGLWTEALDREFRSWYGRRLR